MREHSRGVYDTWTAVKKKGGRQQVSQTVLISTKSGAELKGLIRNFLEGLILIIQESLQSCRSGIHGSLERLAHIRPDFSMGKKIAMCEQKWTIILRFLTDTMKLLLLFFLMNRILGRDSAVFLNPIG